MKKTSLEWLKNPNGTPGYEWFPFIDGKFVDTAGPHTKSEPSSILVMEKVSETILEDYGEESEKLIKYINDNTNHRFLIVTDTPEQFQGKKFGDHVWLGFFFQEQEGVAKMHHLMTAECGLRFLVMDPVYDEISVRYGNVKWVIIGVDPMMSLKNYVLVRMLEDMRRNGVKIFLTRGTEGFDDRKYKEIP